MKFSPTRFSDAWLMEIEPKEDERGFFARTWCRRELLARGLDVEIAQESLSSNRNRGTLRGLHFQRAPHEEVKIVRCTRGAIYDVIVDIRPSSPTFLLWQGFNITAENRSALYIPKGFAHGFQTLVNDSEVMYQITDYYAPESADGCRHDDPAFGIVWPLPVSKINERDLNWPLFETHVSPEI